MTDKFSLKDHLFNEGKVCQLARELAHAYTKLDEKRFVSDIMSRLHELELKARIAWIRECLHTHLPQDYKKAIAIIIKALPPQLDVSNTDDDFGDFIYAPYNDFVAIYGCQREYLPISYDALHELTRRFSAEDAIRHFINAFPDETFAQIEQWSTDENYHVRRLCSEGTRHRLPWCVSIHTHYSKPLSVLDTLHTDPTRYVIRSVANHLNDISKVDPDLVIKTLARWRTSRRRSSPELDYLCTHALRTLVKQGHTGALKLLGFGSGAGITLSDLKISHEVKIGTYLEFGFVLTSDRDARVVADYIIMFAGADGKPAGQKVFKLKNVHLTKQVPITLSKRHLQRADMTTRKIYTGVHTLQIQINGKVLAKTNYRLV